MDQILSANTSGVVAVIPDTDDICVTPLLDVNVVSCNCSNFPATDKVLLPPVDETPERRNSPQPSAGNDDTVDAPNVNNSDDSDEDHWFSDESEGVMFVILFLQHNYSACRSRGRVLKCPRFWVFFFSVSKVGLPLMGFTAVQYTDCYLSPCQHNF